MLNLQKNKKILEIRISEDQFKQLVLNELSKSPEAVESLEGKKISMGITWHPFKWDRPDAIAVVDISEVLELEEPEKLEDVE